jgi:CRISPR-associated protein Cmr2
VPPRTPKHDKDAKLSAVAWVKRSWRRVRDEPGFPSTASIASAPYRQAVLRVLGDGNAAGEDVVRAVVALEEAAAEAGLTDAPREASVPGLDEVMPPRGAGRWLGSSGGPWVYPERWERESLARESEVTDAGRLTELARAGARAARDLLKAMEKRAHLATYLAVVVQDVDSMGRFLSGDAAASDGTTIEVTASEHGRVSRLVGGLAEAQRRTLATSGLLGVPVYSGGDDLLAFTPAATALAAAEAANTAIPPSLPTASTAVLFFHYHASIQQAMRTARHLLEEGKEKVPGKHALAVGYMRRSGASESTVQPWPGPDEVSTAALLQVFSRDAEHRLSPRLVADLERDADELASLLKASDRVYLAELARLVRRHTSDRDAGSAAAAAEALHWLGRNEAALDGARLPHAAAKVGVFLRQEAW